MFSIRSIVLIAAAFAIGAESSVVSSVPVAAAAPLIAQTHLGYAHAVPQNIPPYAAQINTFTKAFAAPLVAPVAAPFAAPVAAPFAAPLAAPVAGPFAAPYLAGPAPYAFPPAPAPYAYAGPFSYGPAPLVRAPYGIAPAFVR